ncbi:ROK family transcriptional regulator [Oricola cellulosilytica]|uniref:ROK family transcriptional regulator n=1 Tax=Oricola cellulosilytica TaxID=1429082 RepID=A0A4V2MNV7_9HYPH|nr:ROK family transcriptional regulator [Oricola cellulosilytica]TCD14947.1 ROK family transcriptional regulator [Oricola cellulosilytica]
MTMVLRSDDMRRRNRLTIMQIVRRRKEISRSEIAQAAALSPATVSTITSDLISEGVLISQTGENPAGTGRGRPSVGLSMNPEFRYAVLLILKTGAVNVAIVDYAGAVVAQQDFRLEMTSITQPEFRSKLTAEIRQTWSASGLDHGLLARISVGIQGVTGSGGRRMLWSPITPLTEVPIGDWLRDEFGVPVRLANDCDLIARALHVREPEIYHENFAAILLAHGVGMGLFLRGQIVNGTRSSGTEFGHMMYMPDGALCRCGSRGCIEAYAGDYALIRSYSGQIDDCPPPPRVEPAEVDRVAEAARSGDVRAVRTFDAAGRAIGSGLAGMFALVDPFRIVLVGHGAEAFDLMEDAIRRTLKNCNAMSAEDIPIDLFPEELPLILEGCGIDALTEIDAAQADQVGEPVRT